jgi:Dolichyl-phosphate-mannose-protein mannosyltransferase
VIHALSLRQFHAVVRKFLLHLSDRFSYLFAVLILLIAAGFRFQQFTQLPLGFSHAEIDNVRIVETVRSGTVETYYTLYGEGREGLYQTLVVASTAITGSGTLGYRVFSVFSGMLTLALVYVLGKRLFGPLAGLAALALLAVSFTATWLDRSIMPETLMPLLVTAVLLALAQSLSVFGERASHPPASSLSYGALGLLLGIGFYIHPSHFALVLATMLFIAYVVLTRQTISRYALAYTSFAILVMIVVVMPYLIASLRQPELAGAGRVFAASNAPLIDTILSGIFGIFFAGDRNPAQNLPARPLIDLISGLFFTLGVVAAVRYWRQSRFALLLIALLVFMPVALLGSENPDFSRFSLLLPIIAVLFGAGVAVIAAGLRGTAVRVFVVALVALFAFNIQWAWRDLFSAWPAEPATAQATAQATNGRLGQIARHLDQTALDIPTLVCTEALRPDAFAAQLTDVQIMTLMMHRTDTQIRYADCGNAIVLADGGGAQQVIFPSRAGINAVNPYLREWLSMGTFITDGDVPPDAVLRMNVARDLANTIGRFTTTAPAGYAPETGTISQIAEPPVRFGGNITFLGYDRVETERFAPGAVVPVYTYWRVDGALPTDLRLFVHMLSDPQVIAVQSDGIGVLVDQLQPRDVIVQATFLQLPFTIPQGRYLLSTGAYEARFGTRLGVFDGDQLRGDRLFIGGVEVER